MKPSMTTQLSAVSLSSPEFTTIAERGRLRSFATAIGQDDIIYSDLGAAREAGYADLPVPPTLLFSLERDGLQAKGCSKPSRSRNNGDIPGLTGARNA